MMKKRTKRIIFAVFILIIALGFGTALGAITWIIKDTPDISNYKGSSEATLIYAADGELLTKLFKENRVYVPLEKIPDSLKDAIVAIEDKNFYVHHGIDFWGVPRAFVVNFKAGRIVQGFSTITMQLAENALFKKQNRGYYRKIQEIYLALQFERLYTKPEILEMYLNEIFLGHSAYGVQTATMQYFGKSVSELTLAESALIAGLPKAPNYYSPYNNIEASKHRRNVVLNKMVELGYISLEEAEIAKRKEIELASKQQEKENIAPYFIYYVRDQLIDQFGANMVYNGGLKVYTTLDIDMQKKAESSVQNAIDKEYIPTVELKNGTQPQMALISIDSKTGEIRSMVGGRGHDQFNRTYQAVRQPGSAFKPFVYTTAINNGYSPASVVNDLPMLADVNKDPQLDIWPRNYGDKYHGYINLKNALTHSVNVAAVKLIEKVGIQETIETTQAMGISTFEKSDYENDHLSLALGGLTRGVTPLEMASAYSVFANEGVYVEPHAIVKVLDKRNNVIYRAQPRKKIILSEETSYLMTYMLKNVINQGTGWRANLGKQPVAGKTGTTNNYTDAWFVGYTPEITTTVWIGEDNVKSMVYDQKDENGNFLFSEGHLPRTVSSSEAAQLWGEYMNQVVKDMPVTYFSRPDNITNIPIDPVTGLRPNDYAPRIIEEPFRNENIPQQTENIHGPVETLKIDRESGLIATENCPTDQVEERHYIIASGIRIGPTTISFSEGANESEENRVSGSYVVDTGEPVQLIDKEIGIPKKDQNGQIKFETRPTRTCNLHPESSETQENTEERKNNGTRFFEDIWDLF